MRLFLQSPKLNLQDQNMTKHKIRRKHKTLSTFCSSAVVYTVWCDFVLNEKKYLHRWCKMKFWSSSFIFQSCSLARHFPGRIIAISDNVAHSTGWRLAITIHHSITAWQVCFTRLFRTRLQTAELAERWNAGQLWTWSRVRDSTTATIDLRA